MPFKPRKWQIEARDKLRKKFATGENRFVLEAFMGTGKSKWAAWITKSLLDADGTYNVNHVLAVAPWQSIQGDTSSGMMGAFGELGLEARSRFFTMSRRQLHQPLPQMDATVTLYQELCCQQTLDTIRFWINNFGWRFAVIWDEIQHANMMSGAWGPFINEIDELAAYSIYMSGTYFRTDKQQICVPYANGKPIRDHRYLYREAIGDRVVRPVTVTRLDATVQLYSEKDKKRYEKLLSEIESERDLHSARRSVLDTAGECMRRMVQQVHVDLERTRLRFPNAGCLYTVRPGGGWDYGTDGEEAAENRHIFAVAKLIRSLTGADPVVISHKDKDAQGKIAAFRNGTMPYIVAVNMIAEGCDIPRLRSLAICRYTESEMLFRQLIGRILRMTDDEDGTAAAAYCFMFPKMEKMAARIEGEAEEGIRDRRCKVCGNFPCICLCSKCEKRPCECDKPPPPPPPVRDEVVCIGSDPQVDGGYMSSLLVKQSYVDAARRIHEWQPTIGLSNPVHLGAMLQLYAEGRGTPQAAQEAAENLNQEKERLCRNVNRLANSIAFRVAKKRGDFKANEQDHAAVYRILANKFCAKWQEIKNTWKVDRIREIVRFLENLLTEFTNA